MLLPISCTVVYLLIPTSNHNCRTCAACRSSLYIFWFLHQTTTLRYSLWSGCRLYIFWFLHQTTTIRRSRYQPLLLYIFWFLHQTTTCYLWYYIHSCCISFDSYIKPQRPIGSRSLRAVVYLLIPTSNHNRKKLDDFIDVLYIFWFLHQTTTVERIDVQLIRLYIFWFLHQTTTAACCNSLRNRCISFDSYIKPQLLSDAMFSTSVVYLLIPTSNHNPSFQGAPFVTLYIFWFLHQTTTKESPSKIVCCCISFDSYIKPQQSVTIINPILVVYLLIPTSNHNIVDMCQTPWRVVYLLIPTSNHNPSIRTVAWKQLYIFWFLHQTTTMDINGNKEILLYIFWFLHQTTTQAASCAIILGCISFDSYIKPQP